SERRSVPGRRRGPPSPGRSFRTAPSGPAVQTRRNPRLRSQISTRETDGSPRSACSARSLSFSFLEAARATERHAQALHLRSKRAATDINGHRKGGGRTEPASPPAPSKTSPTVGFSITGAKLTEYFLSDILTPRQKEPC